MKKTALTLTALLFILISCKKDEEVRPEDQNKNEVEKTVYTLEMWGVYNSWWLTFWKQYIPGGEVQESMQTTGFKPAYRKDRDGTYSMRIENEEKENYIYFGATCQFEMETPEDSMVIRLFKNDSLLEEKKAAPMDTVIIEGIY